MVMLGVNFFLARPALPLGLVIVFVAMLFYAAAAAVRGLPAVEPA